MEKKYHILVADDEASVREVLSDLILALGDEYIVYAAADRYEALHIMQSLPMDLALVDIYMPELKDGFELLKEIKEKYRDVMVVVITGQPSYSMVLEALRLGASDFLAKPISLAELRKILAKLKQEKERLDNQPAEAVRSFENQNLEALTRKMHHKIKEQHFLHSLSEKLGAIRSAKELYPFLTNMALTLTGGIQSAFFLYDQALGRLQLASRTEGESAANTVWPTFNLTNLSDQAIVLPGASEKPDVMPACLSLPLRLRGELLGVLHVHGNPGQNFEPEVINRLQLLVDRSLLTLENLTLHESVFSNLYDTLKALINSLEARDPYSRHHSVRVTHIAANFAQKLPLSTEMVDSLRLAGALHDIGKIGIPDAILLKPDKLEPQEMEIIRQHPLIGENIVAPLNLLPRERALILHHHERWDGKGYPLGLVGEDIPFLSRIIAMADAYDAITSDRPYRRRRTHEEALAEIEAHAGTQFDPDLTRHFIDIMSQPLAAQEICGASAAELENRQPFLTDRQFDLLKKKLSHKLLPLNGYKKIPADFSQPTAARSDI